jgi:hypothetical protein
MSRHNITELPQSNNTLKPFLFRLLLVVLVCLLLFQSCQQTPILDPQSENTDDYQEIQDENILILDDSDANMELSDRATMYIDSIKAMGEFDRYIQAQPCLKYTGYLVLPYLEGVRLKIYGRNLDTSGTARAFITGKTNWNNTSVVKWTKDSVIVDCNNLPYVRNVVLKITLTNTLGKKKSKSIRSVGSNFSYQADPTKNSNRRYITYPHSYWEVQFQMDSIFKKNYNNYEEQPIDSTYIPQVTDLLKRQTQPLTIIETMDTKLKNQFAFIISVGTPDRNGIRKVKVKERNRKCTGTIETATYKYHKGVFTRSGSTTYHKFYRG